jgi:hypothetical protein
MARKGLDEQAKEIEIKLMQLELAAMKAGNDTLAARSMKARDMLCHGPAPTPSK